MAAMRGAGYMDRSILPGKIRAAGTNNKVPKGEWPSPGRGATGQSQNGKRGYPGFLATPHWIDADLGCDWSVVACAFTE